MKIKKVYAENFGNRVQVWLQDGQGEYYSVSLVVNEDGEVELPMAFLRKVTFKRIRDGATKFMDQTTAEAYRRMTQ